LALAFAGASLQIASRLLYIPTPQEKTIMLRVHCILLVAFIMASATAPAQNPVGIFENYQDVGTVLHPGSATFDAAKGTYTLRGSGENIWSTQDAFQFAWKKVSGDVELTADVQFPNTAGNPHKKAVLMLRQSLDPDSAYVDVALHGNSLLALQYRDENGAMTHEVKSSLSPRDQNAPPAAATLPQIQLRLVRRGDYAYMFIGTHPGGYVYMPVSKKGEAWYYDGESIRIPLKDDFYAGIGLCAHDKNAVEAATFSNVQLRSLPPSTGTPVLVSTLETVAASSTDRQVVYDSPGRFEAPNWSRDGSYFLFNRDGHLEKLSIAGGKPEVINTGAQNRLNNDHGISPDGTQLAISDNSQETKSPEGKSAHDSLVYVLPISGGTPRQITRNAPSYWHGWSPDGKTLAFVGQRNGDFDIYTIPVTGAEETRLTTAKGLDDGPEYSPDGQYIYFNSERSGHMQIWRMKPDGGDQEQVFSDDYNNWFPHISPDGKWMVFLTYERDVTGHPENKNVMLRLMNLEDKKMTVLAQLFGGQGTINVPSWSPDSKTIAFVSYALLAPEDAHTDAK
jgi:TolB protein